MLTLHGEARNVAAEGRSRLVEHYLVPAVDQLQRSRQAGEATADDRDPQKNDPGTIRSFFGRESCGLPLKTS